MGLDLNDKVAVVTGASSGIGAALAEALATRGARVALVARRRDRLDTLAARIAGQGGSAQTFVCDVADRGACEATASAIRDALGPIHTLVNSAGYARHILFEDHDVADIEAMVQTNYLGVVYWMKAVLADMKAARSGVIMNLSSFAGRVPQPDEAAYAATKSAITSLSESAGPELARHGIHTMVVHPVLVRTEMFTDEVLSRMPPESSRSFIEPEEFARQTLRALDAGRTSVVIPRSMGAVPILRTLFPRLVSSGIARVKMRNLPEVD